MALLASALESQFSEYGIHGQDYECNPSDFQNAFHFRQP